MSIETERYSTDDTQKAAYLIQDGFALLDIIFTEKNGGKKITANFVLDIGKTDPILLAAENKYAFTEAYPNLHKYEAIKKSLIDRIQEERKKRGIF